MVVEHCNFAPTLAVIAISSTLLISVVSKVRDRRLLLIRMSSQVGPAMSRLWLSALLVFEVFCVSAVLLFGHQNPTINIVVSVLLFALALFGLVILRKMQSCLCFGAASTTKWFSPVCFGIIFLFSVILCSHMALYVSECALGLVTSMSIASIYVVGNYAASRVYLGKKIHMRDIDVILKIVGTSDKPVIFIFASTTCPVCMALLRYLEKVAPHLAGMGRFYLDIDGLVVEEDTSFAGCEVLRNEKLRIRDLISIAARPSMVVVHSFGAIRYTGFQACALVISQVLAHGDKARFSPSSEDVGMFPAQTS